jgi:hypothetical protein
MKNISKPNLILVKKINCREKLVSKLRIKIDKLFYLNAHKI